jgi:hypothetical protein
VLDPSINGRELKHPALIRQAGFPLGGFAAAGKRPSAGKNSVRMKAG